jgi:hypothetical protein
MNRRYRRLTWLVVAFVALAALAAGYGWYRGYVERQMAAAVHGWILARTTEGYIVETDFAEEDGTLATVVGRFDGARIEAPGNAWELTLPRMFIAVDTYDPFGVGFRLQGNSELRYDIGGESHRLQAAFDDARAGFRYRTDGRVTSAGLAAFSSRLSGAAVIGIERFDLRADFDPAASPANDGKSAEIALAVEDAAIEKPSGLPLGDLIRRIEMNAYVAGTLRPGRPSESLTAWRDAGGVLQIERFVADWGPLAIAAEGTLALDGGLQPLFAGTARLRGHGEAIDALAAAGLMAPGEATAAKIALAAMVKPGADGGPPAAQVPLTIQDGFLFAGPLKLAAMPRIVWQ